MARRQITEVDAIRGYVEALGGTVDVIPNRAARPRKSKFSFPNEPVVLAPGQPRVSQARHSAFARTICCDHPYFGARLDAYALVSFLLGQTERIAGLVTVTNLPSRPAPVLARTITSLSTLSGGRILLGIGAGLHLPEHGRHPGRRGAGPLGHRDRPSRPRRDRQVAVFSGRSLRWQDAAVRELPPHLARHAIE